MDLLKRELAPLLPEAWRLIDEEATRVLKLNLAGRKVVDFVGPFGWEHAAVNTGRLHPLESGGPIAVALRTVQPLIELRVPIVLSIAELDAIARGASNPDLAPVVEAARRLAAAEDAAIFGGFAAAGITGILPASPHPPETVTGGVAGLPRAILGATEKLRRAGVTGPYALVLGEALYDQVLAATEDGYPIAKRIEQFLVDAPLVRATALQGAVLLSTRGGDYELTVGGDLSIGYAHHDRTSVELFLTESFTFRVLEPAAAVRITP
jgi:uncharacterized linocin/CFP29 family protein